MEQFKFLFFKATWCVPCTQMRPTLSKFKEEVTRKHSNISVVEVDIEDYPELSAQYGVQSVPTAVLVDGDGDMVSRSRGPISKAQMWQMVRGEI